MKKLLIAAILLTFLVGNASFALAQTRNPRSVVDSVANQHPIPQVPIVVDGERMEPNEIRNFNGQELHYLVNEQALSEGVVYVFTSLEMRQSFVNLANLQNSQIQPSACTFYPSFYQGASYTGSAMTVVPGYSRSFSGSWSSWNNTITSVKTAANAYSGYTKLYDSVWYSGSSLWLATCGNTPNLSIYGWDNRAGSIVVDP